MTAESFEALLAKVSELGEHVAAHDLGAEQTRQLLSAFASPLRNGPQARNFYVTPTSSIAVLGLIPRVYRQLMREGIATVDQLTSCTPSHLLKIDNFGSGSLEEVQSKLYEHGFTLS